MDPNPEFAIQDSVPFFTPGTEITNSFFIISQILSNGSIAIQDPGSQIRDPQSQTIIPEASKYKILK